MWVSDTIDRHHWMFVYLIPGVLGLILLVSLISALVYAGWKNPLMICAAYYTYTPASFVPVHAWDQGGKAFGQICPFRNIV